MEDLWKTDLILQQPVGTCVSYEASQIAEVVSSVSIHQFEESKCRTRHVEEQGAWSIVTHKHHSVTAKCVCFHMKKGTLFSAHTRLRTRTGQLHLREDCIMRSRTELSVRESIMSPEGCRLNSPRL